MAAVAGLRGTGDWGTDERPKTFREMILWRNPNGNSPIFALMARVQKESTDDPEYSWWDEPNDLVRLQVNGALAAGDTTIVVDSGDPSAVDAERDRNWGLATHLKAGDHLLVEADNDPFVAEVVEVETVISPTTFTVKRGAQGTTPGVIANDAYLLLIGSAYGEGTPSPEAVSRNPIKYSNFTQIWKTSYELTGSALVTRTRTGDPLQNDKKRKMFDHSRAIELSILFGQKSETTDDNGKPKRTTQGLRASIPGKTTTIIGATELTVTNILNAIYPVFDYETPAGDTRMGFCGNGALNALNLMINSDAGTTINFGGVIGQYGMNFREFIMPQGRLLLRTHPLLNRHSVYTNSIFVVDFASMRWRPLRGRDTKPQDNIQNRDEDTRKGQWLTEAGLEVRYGGLTNAYVGGVSAANLP